MDCTIRTMRSDEIAIAIEFAALEGWNPGLHDGACFHAADPGGFLVAECLGQPVGCIAAVSYAGRFGFIGLYIVARLTQILGHPLSLASRPGRGTMFRLVLQPTDPQAAGERALASVAQMLPGRPRPPSSPLAEAVLRPRGGV